MKVWFVMTLVVGICWSVFGDGITTVEVNEKQYTNVYDVHIGANGKVVIFSSNGATTASADNLPADFLKSWNINSEDAKATETRKAAEDID